MRITGIAQPHRAFRQSADAKLTVPPMTPEKFATNIGRQLRQQYSLAATTLILGLAVSCVFASELGVAGLLGTGIASATLLLAKPRSKLDQISHAYQVAKERWDKIKGRWATADPASPFAAFRSSIENKKREYEQLPGDKAHRLQTLQQTVRERQLMAHLNRQRIAGAKVQGVGQSKIIALQSYSIETAADITDQRILGVPGFGPVLAGRLVHWRMGCERRFTFDPRKGIPQSDIDTINRELSIKQRRLEQELTVGVSQLSAISRQTIASRELLHTQALEILPIYARCRPGCGWN
jgi:DNA-binding helix-hairpin-helix protein with protein kinase domain